MMRMLCCMLSISCVTVKFLIFEAVVLSTKINRYLCVFSRAENA